MGSEIAVPVFGPLIVIMAIMLTIVAIRGRRRIPSGTSTFCIDRRRIALGYLGVLVASIPVAVWMAHDDAKFQVANHYITDQDAARYQPGWSLSFYCIVTPVAIFLLTVAGLPLLALLRKVRLASAAGCLGVGLILSVTMSYWLSSVSFETIAIWEIEILGFVLASKLPLFRSSFASMTEAEDLRRFREF
jgi:hypothetical protein